MRPGLILIAIQLLSIPAFPQVELSGVVLHEKTKSPLPFVNIVIRETRQGVASDIEGRFKIVCQPGQTVEFRYVGFQNYSLASSASSASLIIELKERVTELSEIVVRPGENPALKIIRKVIANRDQNDPENLPSFTYNSYNKLSCALEPTKGYSNRQGFSQDKAIH